MVNTESRRVRESHSGINTQSAFQFIQKTIKNISKTIKMHVLFITLILSYTVQSFPHATEEPTLYRRSPVRPGADTDIIRPQAPPTRAQSILDGREQWELNQAIANSRPVRPARAPSILDGREQSELNQAIAASGGTAPGPEPMPATTGNNQPVLPARAQSLLDTQEQEDQNQAIANSLHWNSGNNQPETPARAAPAQTQPGAVYVHHPAPFQPRQRNAEHPPTGTTQRNADHPPTGSSQSFASQMSDASVSSDPIINADVTLAVPPVSEDNEPSIASVVDEVIGETTSQRLIGLVDRCRR
jgi:hypothetical protein